MSRSSYQQVFLNQQADQLERTLSSLSLPVKVYGGSVSEDRIRYRLTPVSGTRPQAVAQAAEQVANALGVAKINIAREAQDLAIDVPVQPPSDLRLLPLLHAMHDLASLAVVLGMSRVGSPLAFYLTQPSTWHFWIHGRSGCGKSEQLRTAVLSLALTGRRSEIQFLGVDMSGRELAVLEALPHNLAALATTPDYAADLILWLAEEVDRRLLYGITQPHLAMVIDDLDWIEQVEMETLAGALRHITREGISAGVHLITASQDPTPASLRNVLTGSAVVEAQPASSGAEGIGSFELTSGREKVEFDLAWLSLHDLDAAVRLVQSGWRASGRNPLIGI
ncbi:MAG: DNA translocase FtsK [Anaerolineales bacterium]|jgi:DNA segregation ATPase FtsK/SpoIIIE-like protein